MSLNVATAIARILKQEGTQWVSTFPVCRVNNALGREGVPMIMMRDDRYAIALADAFSRVTAGERIGVCTVQGGVNAAGLQVAYAGLAQAYEDGSPMLCITDGVPQGQSEHSQFDLATSLRSVSKWYGYIDRAERVPEFMRRAFTMLRSGRPGPVVLAVPDASAEFDETRDPYLPVKGWKTLPDPDDVGLAIDLLLGARNPVLYVGEGAVYARAASELLEFAELAGAPVVCTLKAKGVFPDTHPLALGVRGEQVSQYLTDADMIFAIGSSLSPGRFSHAIPEPHNKTIVSCINDELHINRIYPTRQAVLGDVRHTLQALSLSLREKTGGNGRKAEGVRDRIRDTLDQAMTKYREAMNSQDKPINPYRVYKGLMEVLDPRNSFVTHESGNTRDQLSTVYPAVVPRAFLGWGNVSTLGFSLPAAMAARLADPARPAIAVSGDAGVGYMMGNLEVLVRERIGITVVHVSNGGFAGYGPGFWGAGHDPYTHQVTGYEQIDMSRAVGELGLHTQRIDTPDQIEPALRNALAANAEGKPAFIEFICSQYPVYGQWLGRGG
ncbi:MAG: hypothetical protein KDK91_04870 [Gammaproteobacteria bacterium]|nr:hypothetical protein [Gammaproteobacteria bacterium]